MRASEQPSRAVRLCVTTLLLGTVTLFAGRSKSVWSGVFTPEQASAGETLYFQRCATCHGDDLGGIEKAPALTGAQFRDSWHGKTLRKLFERIQSMPPDEPRAVSDAEAVDVLAFLLLASEMPAGAAPLPVDRTQLNDITFERTKP